METVNRPLDVSVCVRIPVFMSIMTKVMWHAVFEYTDNRCEKNQFIAYSGIFMIFVGNRKNTKYHTFASGHENTGCLLMHTCLAMLTHAIIRACVRVCVHTEF